MKLQITGTEMWTHADCTCRIMCMNGVWMWRTVKVTGDGMKNGIAFSKEEAKAQAEQASAKMSDNQKGE